MTVTVDVEDKSVQKPPVIMQEVLLYYEKQTVPRFSVALAMKNKTPFDMTLKVFVSLELSSQMQRYIKINFKRRFPVQAFAWTLI